ncbi:GIY-YIG nuclease family protein [Neolewinella agarilytica]|uniref:Putative endonuclease n=1 Tax=Neolewinella agarilytica TaxID=478744 RepID=A0A1H9FT48_9BACT|nr:GIY-YIG nuclease family protein [Neolewinella agarilytica]SEQ41067.1 putative endonuclease [Neolewinella agarilytica]
MYYVYILYSPTKDKYYIGYTGQLTDRFQRHQQGRSKSTKAGRPWLIAYLERFDDPTGAYRRESYIKKQKSRKYVQALVDSYHANPFPLPSQ